MNSHELFCETKSLKIEEVSDSTLAFYVGISFEISASVVVIRTMKNNIERRKLSSMVPRLMVPGTNLCKYRVTTYRRYDVTGLESSY